MESERFRQYRSTRSKEESTSVSSHLFSLSVRSAYFLSFPYHGLAVPFAIWETRLTQSTGKETNEKTSVTRNTKTALAFGKWKRTVDDVSGCLRSIRTLSASLSTVTDFKATKGLGEEDLGRPCRATTSWKSPPSSEPAFVIRADASPFVSFLVAVCGTPASLVSFQFSTVSYCTTISLSRPLWLGANQGVDD